MYKDQDTNGIDKGNKEANRHSLPSPITSSVTSGTESRGAWFGSRKLDGVRCLITINLATGEAEAMSRSGRPFATLGDIEKAVSDMVGGDSLEQRTKFFAIATGHNFPYQSNTDTTTKSFTSETATETRTKGNKDRLLMHPSSLPESLILDGEICVLDASQMTRTPLSGGKGEEQAIKTEEGPFDFDHGGIGQENFLKTIGYILRSASPSAPLSTDLKEASKKRKKKSKGQALEEEDDLGADGDREDDPLKSLSHINKAASSEATNIQPVYCIFDCLTEQEFRDRKGTRPFSQRIQNLWRAMNYARTSQTLPPNSNNDTIRILPQHRISSFEQLEQIVAQSLERDWEGVMLRKDVGYEGRRSRNLLKIKKFQDAEFVVEDVMTGKMRLPDPITGQFEEREVLTSVVIRHKGSPVRVGSGFSVEDRIRYGQQPSLILGKTITVQYFEESTSIRSSALSSGQEGSLDSPRTGSRDDDEANGSVSLRFPTVKAIYESGEREV
ncbi:hypothetical protein BGW41_005563 [Actinomortierella wolfii]|nr:hypothetical protein BGW41_005563 [Actinomortierella wolfii]